MLTEQQKEFIREKVNQLQATYVQAQSISLPDDKPIERSSPSWPLITCLLLLLMTTVGFVVFRPRPRPTAAVQTVIPSSSTAGGNNEELQLLRQKMDTLSKDVQSLQTRQWLIAIAQNENAQINRQIAKKVQPDLVDNFLLLNSSWKLNRAPEFIQMTDKDRKFLADKIGP